MKKLVGGGTMTIVNQTVPRALRRLGYTPTQIDEIVAYIDENKTHPRRPAPRRRARRRCSPARWATTPSTTSGHVQMMGAVQPFISGAISKTVNMPEEVTVEEVEQLHIDAWQLGVKAVAIYRDNCKVAQPLSMAKKDGVEADAGDGRRRRSPPQVVERIVEKVVHEPVREKLPRTRTSKTFEFRVADCKGFVTVGEYEDGRPGEIFVRVSKQGSTLAGIMDAFAISVSHGLQYGVPLRSFVEAFTGMRFEPAGMTDDPDIRIANSPAWTTCSAAWRSSTCRPRSGPSSTSSPPPSACSPRCPASRRPSSRPARAPTSPPTRRRSRRPSSSLAETTHGRRPASSPRPHSVSQRRPDVHAVRRPDAAGRLLPRLPQLRHHQRLLVVGRSSAPGARATTRGHREVNDEARAHRPGPRRVLRCVGRGEGRSAGGSLSAGARSRRPDVRARWGRGSLGPGPSRSSSPPCAG